MKSMLPVPPKAPKLPNMLAQFKPPMPPNPLKLAGGRTRGFVGSARGAK